MKRLTTHVLDTASGKPGSNIKIELYSVNGKERTLVRTVVTNDDGRTNEPLLEGDDFAHGVWELLFHVGDYFAESTQQKQDTPAFLNEIPICFGISADAHYHVPLLVSPWSYSTYRGS